MLHKYFPFIGNLVYIHPRYFGKSRGIFGNSSFHCNQAIRSRIPARVGTNVGPGFGVIVSQTPSANLRSGVVAAFLKPLFLKLPVAFAPDHPHAIPFTVFLNIGASIHHADPLLLY